MIKQKISLSALLKGIILLSILLNIAFLYKYGKNYFYTHKDANSSEKVAYLYNRQTVYQNLQVKKDDIVFVGDSHTQKFEVHEFFNAENVKNRGIDGDVTAGVLNRLNPITKGHPKKIFLQIGINDVLKNHNIIKAIPNYKHIIQDIREESPETKIYVESIMPSEFADKDTVLKYNRLIKQISSDSSLTFIDLYDKFNEDGKLNKKYDCGDAIHLNGEGYVLWTKILKPYM